MMELETVHGGGKKRGGRKKKGAVGIRQGSEGEEGRIVLVAEGGGGFLRGKKRQLLTPQKKRGNDWERSNIWKEKKTTLHPISLVM